jgi:hypothetical protein
VRGEIGLGGVVGGEFRGSRHFIRAGQLFSLGGGFFRERGTLARGLGDLRGITGFARRRALGDLAQRNVQWIGGARSVQSIDDACHFHLLARDIKAHDRAPHQFAGTDSEACRRIADSQFLGGSNENDDAFAGFGCHERLASCGRASSNVVDHVKRQNIDTRLHGKPHAFHATHQSHHIVLAAIRGRQRFPRHKNGARRKRVMHQPLDNVSRQLSTGLSTLSVGNST